MSTHTIKDNYCHNQKGSVFILAVWVLMFLSVLAVVFGSISRSEINVLNTLKDRGAVYDLSSSGVLMMTDILSSYSRRDITPEVDSLNDFWADDSSLFGLHEMGEGTFAIEYKYKDNVTDVISSKFGAFDEERKININYAGHNVLVRLFSKVAGLDEVSSSSIAGAIIDWRDTDDVLYPGDKGLSESKFYADYGYAYAPKNGLFSTLEEVLLVARIDNKAFQAIKEYITVFSNSRININTVSVPVMTALGLDEGLARKVALYRAGPDMSDGTLDDNVFNSPKQIAQNLLSQYKLTDREKDQLAVFAATSIIDVKSNTFAFFSTGRVRGTSASGTTFCVMEKSGLVRYIGYVAG